MEGLWITFLTILGWFQASCRGRFRHILDTNSEPAQDHEKLDFCCDLLYFRHLPDPENDAISEQFHVVVFFQGTVLGPAFQRTLFLGVFWGLYWGTVGSLFGVVFRVFKKGGQ